MQDPALRELPLLGSSVRVLLGVGEGRQSVCDDRGLRGESGTHHWIAPDGAVSARAVVPGILRKAHRRPGLTTSPGTAAVLLIFLLPAESLVIDLIYQGF